MKVKIAVAQFKINQLSSDDNIQRAEAIVKKAAEKNADVIVFPEDMMTGSIFGNRSHLFTAREFQSIFSAWAKKYEIDIIPGSHMEKGRRGAYNTTHYIDKNGNVLANYRKMNLYLSERSFLRPGDKISVFDTSYGRVALTICWDITHPELFRRLAKHGVDIVFCLSYWWKEIAGEGLKINNEAEETHVDAMCLARAVENNMVIVYANAAGVMKYPNGTQDTLIGRSQIAAPFYGTLAKAAHNHEALIMADVDLNVLTTAEKIYKLRHDILKNYEQHPLV